MPVSSTSPSALPGPPFRDRAAAGAVLAEALRGVLPGDAVVVGLARGGVVVAAEVARRLGLGLDVVAVRKVGAPVQPEYALGAVAPGEGAFLHDRAGLRDEELAALVEDARRRAGELDRRLHADVPPLPLAGRACALVDDGLATGSTMVAAVRWALQRGAARVVAAVPVGARQSAALLRAEGAEVVCPYLLADFGAVGFWYVSFAQVEDDEVTRLLAEARAAPPGGS